MRRSARYAPLAAILLSGGLPAGAQTIYGLSNGNLIRFEAATPGAVTTIGELTEDIVSLDFRPSDGRLYGYAARLGADDDAVFAIDTNTAALSLIRTTTPSTITALLGVDFDPQTDRLRVVSDQGENLRLKVDLPGITDVDGDIHYPAGDRFGGRFPLLINIAHAPLQSASVLYGIDYLRDTLVRFESPATGALATVGNLGVNTDRFTGFDIGTASGGGTVAFAALNPSFLPSSTSSLYTINLTTGAATAIGAIGAPGVYGIAIAPAASGAAAPEPSTFALLAALLPLVRLRTLARRAGG